MAAPDQPPASPPPEPGDGLATDQGHGQEQERRAEPPVAPSDFNEILFARTLMSSTTIGIMAIASAGQFVFCNEAMRDMFGFPAELLQRHDAPALLEH
ncbi:MAG TPA: PAS domain-containing protein, partial [Pseudomonadota bacterium]|nr:PAS domain-containing protein [Pseudomonadota bacterium]